MLDKIAYTLQGKGLSNHQKCVHIWLLSNKIEDFPKLPPCLCECKITLKNGKVYKAYIDRELCGPQWVEYGNTWRVRMKGRRRWEYEEVDKWEFI